MNFVLDSQPHAQGSIFFLNIYQQHIVYKFRLLNVSVNGVELQRV
jgi:hypothetical protein